MSSVSDRMAGRRLGAGAPTVPAGRRTLDQLGRGEVARVAGYDTGIESGAARRLFDLGLAPGIEVEMVRRAPLRDPVIYRVGDYEIALRAAQSRGIVVEPVR